MTSATPKRPISSHPAFRWAVALWFALLLGAGLFVMPEAVQSSLRHALRLDGILPDGVAGRMALAGIAALFGFVLGLVIAMRVAAFGDAAAQQDEDHGQDDVWLEDEGDLTEAAPEGVADEPRRFFNPREHLADDAIDSDDVEVFAEEDEGPGEFSDRGVREEYLPEDEAVEPAETGNESLAEEVLPETWQSAEQVTTPAPIEVASERLEASQRTIATPQAEATAFGDLSLADLTARLGRALEARRAAESAGPVGDEGDVDPVIAFLRREADRTTPARGESVSDEDPQAVLRGALDRLSQVSNPR